jgi:hypothetical protein
MLTRTAARGRVVEEAIATFDHEGTGRTVSLPHVVVHDGAADRYYFDGATVLVQAGLLDDGYLPVSGAEQAAKARNPRGLPSNELMGRWAMSVDDVAPPYAAAPVAGDHPTVLDEHLAAEFAFHDVDRTMATMAPDPYLNHVPVLTGGVGWDEVHRFYKHHFIPGWPEDVTTASVARTVTPDRVVDELLVRFTHDREMDAIIPGVAATGCAVELPVAVMCTFVDGRLESEHVYWDQARALRQIGALAEG